MSLAILFHFLCAQHVSDINISIIRSMRLFCWITTLVVLFVVAGWSCASACNTDITPTHPHRNSNTHRTKNNTTNVVIQQNSRMLLMMDILMSETCWARRKWNKIANDINQVGLLFFNYHNDAWSNEHKIQECVVWYPNAAADGHRECKSIPEIVQDTERFPYMVRVVEWRRLWCVGRAFRIRAQRTT